jgi:hypothetical protein
MFGRAAQNPLEGTSAGITPDAADLVAEMQRLGIPLLSFTTNPDKIRYNDNRLGGL